MSKPKSSGRAAQPLFTISVASRLCSLPVHTIRWLEAHEFVQPWRTQGNQRLFSESDIERLLEIRGLLERRVNIAGIRTIMTIKRTYRIRRLVL